MKTGSKAGLFNREMFHEALKGSFVKLNPVTLIKNPVMFSVEVGTVIILAMIPVKEPGYSIDSSAVGYDLAVAFILFITVLFGNFAEALAESRGKAQAATLRRTREETPARKVLPDGTILMVNSTLLIKGDVFMVEAGEMIPLDGEITEGMASIDESAITGESAPVIREAGTDHSGVIGGTLVISDSIKVVVTSGKGESFLDKMIALVEGANRQKTPNEIALTILLSSFTIIFLVVTVTLYPVSESLGLPVSVTFLIALFVCLIPTTIGGLLSAIGISGMERALKANIIAKSGKAVENSGDIDVVMLDKTGTITLGNRRATAITPLEGHDPGTVARYSLLSSLADSTPEGKSIVDLAGGPTALPEGSLFIPFTASTRMSGIDLPDGTTIRKGAWSAIRNWITDHGSDHLIEILCSEIAMEGGTPLVVAYNRQAVGVIHLEDIIKPGIRERFQRLSKMGVKTVMVTGDNPQTAACISRLAGVDDHIAEAKPEDKLNYILREQATGRMVAMMGDGTNDSPALAQADVGVAMNSGTQAAKEAANMVDLDNDPAKLLEVIEIGKQLLITRGNITTFSIVNDVAKYFAIVPALFAASVPGLKVLDIMDLGSPSSAVLSAVIFNALVIPALIPLALRGSRYKPLGASALLVRNLLFYGAGGLLVPFAGIKLIDILITFLFYGG